MSRRQSFRCPPRAAIWLMILLPLWFGHQGVLAAGPEVDWDARAEDSLFSLAAGPLYPPEPSIQQILDSLGYDIDAATDTVNLNLFCLYPESAWRLVAEYSGAANTHTAGWYRSGYARDTHTVITGTMIPGDSVVVTSFVSTRRGLFQRRDAGTAWYTEPALNYDRRAHHKVYPLPGGVGYIVFWEDLGWVTDGDYNDMVFEVRPQNLPPTLTINYPRTCTMCPPHLICEGDSACIEIHVVDNGCFGDTVTVEMVAGEGSFTPVTGVGDFVALHCWLPIWEGSRQFTFRATDNLGLAAQNDFWSNVRFDHTPPDLPDPVTTQTAACLPGQVCVNFPITDTTATRVWIVPQGIYDEAAQTACFDADTAGTYRLWVFAADTCGNADSTLLTVTVSGKHPPIVTASPDHFFQICGAENLCARFSVFDADNDVVSVSTDTPGFINLADSTVCYTATGPGTVVLPVYVIDACGFADTAQVTFHVTGGAPVTLNCPSALDTVLCREGDLCFPISYSGGTGQVRISVSPTGSYDAATGRVCFTANVTQTYNLTVIAQDDCGADTCTVPVAVTINRPPQIALPDHEALLCQQGERVCVVYACGDPDNNLLSCSVLEAPQGYQIEGGLLCFTPTAAGTYRVIAQAIDQCGATQCDTAMVQVRFNSAPDITAPATLSVGLCGPDSVCFNVGITDVDNNITDVSVSPNASYNRTLGRVCFYAPTSGNYTVRITAHDACGASDIADVQATVSIDVPPQITCPNRIDTLLCAPGQMCFPLPLYSGGLVVSVSPIGTYDYANQRVCFNADTAGLYRLTVIARDTCGGADTCVALVGVTLNRVPTITAQSGLMFTLCRPAQVCIPASCADPDGNLLSCTLVSGSGTYDGSQICFTPTQSGRVNFVVRATDMCGATREQQVYADVTLNAPPTITATAAVTRTICAPETICANFTASDPEGGPLSFSSTHGQINAANRTLCVLFNSDSNLCVNIYAVDTCGNADTATVCFTIKLNRKPDLTVALTFTFDLCAPGQVCFPVTATDREGLKSSSVTPLGAFNSNYTSVCFNADTAGTYSLTLIVIDSCLASDTATTRVTVNLNRAPTLTVPGNTGVFRCATGQQTCVAGISGSDPDGNLDSVRLTSGPGVFNPAAGEICFAPDTVGTYCFTFTATDHCQATAVRSFCVTVTVGRPPVITLDPSIDVSLEYPGVVCFPIGSADPDANQQFNLEKTHGAGTFVTRDGRNSITAEHCFPADTAGCYPFTFRSTDSCGLFDIESTLVCVTITPPDTSFRICLDTAQVMNGRNVDAHVILYETLEMGGFDFMICFDRSALSFRQAARGAPLADWEYFTYRVATPSGCVNPCSATAVHLVAIADMNNGFAHPPEEAYEPQGILATLTFFVTEDRTFIGQCVPLSFCSYECADNTISSRTGDTLFVAYTGVPAECLTGTKYAPIPAIEFCDGRICIIPPPDDRGDINLNGVAYEVGDAVLFTNYFIYGNSVWDPLYYENQWLASDVNADGYLRSIADLVYLIRIITGDASPITKPVPTGTTMAVEARLEHGELVITSHSPVRIGGLFVRLTGDVGSLGQPIFAEDVASLSPRYHNADTEWRLLIVGTQQGAAIPAGSVELARIPLSGTGAVELAEADAAGYYGEPLEVQLAGRSAPPQRFELLQNYPNPFNAATVIRLAMPLASDYRISIYDITGRRVRDFSGSAGPGVVQISWDGLDENGRPVASGLYFYRAVAADFTSSRKMLLVK